jgi:hypothetical protein
MADSPDDLMARFGDAVANEAPAEPAPVTQPVETPTAQAEEPTVDEPVTEPTAEEQQTEPAEPTEPTAEAPTGEPAAEPAPTIDPEEAAGRYRLKGKLAAVAQLTKEGMSEAEAIERVYGKSPTAPTEPTEPAAPVEDPVAKLETELADVRTKLKTAAAEGVLYNDELDALNERRSELLIEIREAKGAKARAEAEAEAQAQQSEDEQFDAEWQTESATLAEWYGDAAKDDGALGRVFLEEGSKAAKDPSHRFHRHWQSGTFTPLTIGPLLAAELNISRVSKAPAAAAPQSPPPPSRVLPVSGGARTTPPPVNNAAVAEAQRRERIAKATSADDIEAVYAEANGGMTSRGSGFRLA